MAREGSGNNILMMFFIQVLGEKTKNHQNDSENLEKGGIVPYATDEYGFNPGKFLELYLDSTNEKLDRLFQKPQRAAKWFSVHKFEITTLYENAPIGRNLIGNMLKTLCTAAGVGDKYTNHCLRSTGIQNLKKLGIQDRDIVNVSGNYTMNSKCEIKHPHLPNVTSEGGNI